MSARRAIIFDLDGTLIDSLRDIADAVNRALALSDLPRAAITDIQSWIGDGLAMLCRRAAPTIARDEIALAGFVKSVASFYEAGCLTETRPYPNILKMLDLLTTKNRPMAVLSNKPHEFTRRIVEGLGLAPYFQIIQGCEIEADRKPDPRMARSIAHRLECEPRSVALVGDSAIDIETARRAEMFAVAVTWGFRSAGECRAARPDLLVDSPLELADALQKNF